MKIIYASCVCEKERFNSLFTNSEIKPGQQVQKYHRLLIEGLANLENVQVETVTALPINKLTSSKIFNFEFCDKLDNVNYNYLPIINISLIKNICIFLEAFIFTLFKMLTDKNTILIADVLNISVSFGSVLASRIMKRQSIGIVTDIPSFLNKKSNSLIVKINNYVIQRFESYIFLTDEMSKVVNIKNKSFIVIEGLVDIKMSFTDNIIIDKYDKKICIYAGGLQKTYGIEYLISAFIKANIKNSELHVYGDGEYAEDLKKICINHSNVKYFGVMPNDYIIKEEIKASLLINPRPTSEEYTKYSFPSKNMEYMVSGTPVLTTKLPGMPKEYYDYVYIIKGETVDGLVDTLNEILNKSSQELHKYGIRAKEWVLKNKNNNIQAKKVFNIVR